MTQGTTKRLPTIGTVIRAWRTYHGFSSTELAEKAGVRLGYLSEIEHDRTLRPYEDYLEKLADALHVPLGDILGRRMPDDVKDGNIVGEENWQGIALGEVAEGEAPGGVQPALGQPRQKASSASTLINSPLSTPHQKILMRKLEVLERTIREIRALVGPTQDQE